MGEDHKNNNTQISELKLNQHIENECECPYVSVGCKYNKLLEKELKNHEKEYLVDHMNYVFKYLHERTVNTQHEIYRPNTLSLAAKKQKSEADQSSSVNTFEDEQKLFNALANAALLLEKLPDTSKLKKKVENNRKKLEQLQKCLTVAQATIIELEDRLFKLQTSSLNGTFVWKITGVQQKIQDAKSGKQTSFYSPPFYSHHNGYKMCGRIYLNGDGMGKGTHVSLFFIIMKGEYDAMLNWPFRQKVTFTLIDQSQKKEDNVDSFKPDPNSVSFRRPVSGMNIASGIPLFCHIEKLHSTDHEYIKDDTMFIKIIVCDKKLADV